MQTEINSLKKAQDIMKLALLVGVVSLGLSLIKNFVTEYWALNRDNVACIPSDIEHQLPFAYRQTTSNPTESDALIKEFVENYVHLAFDENIVDYNAVSNNQRYKNARLSKSKWKAIEMSVGVERALNMKKYSESNQLFYDLQRGNMGWVFFIDDILIHSIPNSGNVLAVVRGEYQVTYDKVKRDIPSRLWGYREIHLLIQQGVPTEDSKGEQYDNKYGLFVSWSNSNTLTPEQKEKLSERTYDYYTLKEFK